MSHQDELFRAVATRNLVRPSVRAIVIVDRLLLVQRPADEPDTFYAFIGGEYEVGDTFESRLRREFAEETSAQLVTCTYRFVLENCFVHADREIHGLDHFCEVTLDRREIDSRGLFVKKGGRTHPGEESLPKQDEERPCPFRSLS